VVTSGVRGGDMYVTLSYLLFKGTQVLSSLDDIQGNKAKAKALSSVPSLRVFKLKI
jgi:hypothetical protein